MTINRCAQVVMVVISVVAVVLLGPIAGAILGNIASQLAGKAMGVVDSFSWKAVGKAALSSILTAGITAGIGEALSAVGNLGASFSWAATAARFLQGSSTAVNIFKGVANYAGGYISGRLMGENPSFSWKEMGSSVVSSMIGGRLARTSNGGTTSLFSGFGDASPYVAGVVGDNLSAAISDKWFGGSKPDYLQVSLNAIATAAGQDIGQEILGTGFGKKISNMRAGAENYLSGMYATAKSNVKQWMSEEDANGYKNGLNMNLLRESFVLEQNVDAGLGGVPSKNSYSDSGLNIKGLSDGLLQGMVDAFNAMPVSPVSENDNGFRFYEHTQESESLKAFLEAVANNDSALLAQNNRPINNSNNQAVQDWNNPTVSGAKRIMIPRGNLGGFPRSGAATSPVMLVLETLIPELREFNKTYTPDQRRLLRETNQRILSVAVTGTSLNPMTPIGTTSAAIFQSVKLSTKSVVTASAAVGGFEGASYNLLTQAAARDGFSAGSLAQDTLFGTLFGAGLAGTSQTSSVATKIISGKVRVEFSTVGLGSNGANIRIRLVNTNSIILGKGTLPKSPFLSGQFDQQINLALQGRMSNGQFPKEAGQILDNKLEGELGLLLKDDLVKFRVGIFPEDIPSTSRGALYNSPRPQNAPVAEIDIETSNYIIEVTNGKNSKLDQIQNRLMSPEINPMGKPVILLAPKYSTRQVNEYAKLGTPVFRNTKDLMSFIQRK